MMKKVLFAACSICIAAAAVAAPLSAFAAEDAALPQYPEIHDDVLVLDSLTDFAVAEGSTFALANGNTVVRCEGEFIYDYEFDSSVTDVYEFDSSVTDIDYDQESEKFYYSLDGGETSYILPDSPEDLPGEQAEHNFEASHITKTARDLKNGFIYYYNDSGELVVVDKIAETTTPLNLTNAKVYGDKLYAIFDICIYEIIGKDPEKIEIRYSNYDKLKYIYVGDVAEKLKTYSTFDKNPRYVNIATAYATRFTLDLLAPYDENGNEQSAPEYFPVSDPKNNTSYISGRALLLYQSEEIRIVAQGKNTYIMRADGAIDLDDDLKTPVEEGTTATANVVGGYAHSLPFMSNATRTFAIAPNEELKILYRVSNTAAHPDVLAYDFYLVENSEGEQGYVITRYFNSLNQPPINEGEPTTHPDGSPSTDNRIKTVILIIVVVALVLICAGYITWVVTSGKRKKPVNNKNDGEIDLSDNKNSKNGQK